MAGFLFDLPLAVAGPLIILTLCAVALAGLLVVRRRVLPRLGVRSEDSEFTGAMLQSVMVFYGLAVALIAVSVFETYSEVSALVSREASEMAAMYRDASAYPEPLRGVLQQELRDYARYVIDEAWPALHRGETITGGVEMLNRFQASLTTFEPATEGQKVLHAEALRAYNQLVEARALRLDAAVNTGLPGVLWFVIVAGAVISLNASFYFRVESLRLHALLVTHVAAFIGLVIVMTVAFDRPFRGDLALQPEPYQLVYDQVMSAAR